MLGLPVGLRLTDFAQGTCCPFYMRGFAELGVVGAI